jgi:hypothetical protein
MQKYIVLIDPGDLRKKCEKDVFLIVFAMKNPLYLVEHTRAFLYRNWNG